MTRAPTLFAAFALSALTAAGQDADPARKRIDTAREAYDRAVLKYETAAVEWFEKLEDEARKKGDKKLVDQVAAQLKQFVDDRELPAAAPKTIRAQLDAPRKAVEVAYADAIKTYVKGRMDDQAAAVEAGLAKFRYSTSHLGRTVGDAKVKVVNKHSGRILATMNGGSKADGTGVMQYDDTGGRDQVWRLVPTDEEYFLILNVHSGFPLTKLANDSPSVVISKQLEGDREHHQHWRAVPAPDQSGWYLLQNRVSGKYLGIENGATNKDARVVQAKLGSGLVQC